MSGSRTITSRAGNPVVFFDVTIGGNKTGRIEMELFVKEAPSTVENFRSLCNSNSTQTFKGSLFHKVIPGLMCQGGDFIKGDGSGHKTIYGDNIPAFESKPATYTRGSLATAHVINAYDDPEIRGIWVTRGSQFYLVLGDAPFLDDGSHTLFGRVTKGLDLVDEMEKVGTRSGVPTAEIKITNSGQLRG